MPLLGLWTRPYTQLSRSHALGSHRLILHGKGGCWGPAGPAPVTPVTLSWTPQRRAAFRDQDLWLCGGQGGGWEGGQYLSPGVMDHRHGSGHVVGLKAIGKLGQHGSAKPILPLRSKGL